MKPIFLSLLIFCLAMKNVKAKVKKIQILSSRANHSLDVTLSIHHIWLHGLMIKISGDIEFNPEPKQKQDQSLSICHWNLNSIPAHNFQKLELLLEGYISSSKVDILCLSENFLNSDISCHDNYLQLPGFDLIRAINHLTQKNGVCIYYWNFFPLKLIKIYYLNESTTFEIKLGEKNATFLLSTVFKPIRR